MGKFFQYYIIHHGRIDNGMISISFMSLVISTFKNAYLSYSLFDYSETLLSNMFL